MEYEEEQHKYIDYCCGIALSRLAKKVIELRHYSRVYEDMDSITELVLKIIREESALLNVAEELEEVILAAKEETERGRESL